MRFGTFLGIPLKVNPFFFLFLAGAFIYGRLLEALVLFAIVLWHETSHVLMAKAYKLEVIDIELLPFGGVARLGALLQLNPEIEWIIAIVGPLSNVALVFLGFGLSSYLPITQEWYDFFVRANLGMAAFNLLPVLPLDGGRVLRSFLVSRRGFKQATAAISGVGQVLSAVVAAWGGFLFYIGKEAAPLFVFGGCMLFWSARQEQKNASYVFMRYLTHKKQQLRLKRALVGRYLVATEETSLGEVLDLFQPPHYHLICVLDLDGETLGFIGELELIQAVFEHGIACKIANVIK